MALTDLLVHPPPFIGPYPYSPPASWRPGQAGFLARGETYVDPVFGQTVRRLTDVYPGVGDSEIYGQNAQWNANGTRRIHNPNASGALNVVDATTGAVVRAGIPSNINLSRGFDPVWPNIYYYESGNSLHKYDHVAGTDVVVKNFGSALGDTGGSVDFVDNSGRYFVVVLGGVGRFWDGSDANGHLPGDPAYVPQAAGTSGLYTGNITAGFGGGWLGMAPDGSGVLRVVGGTTTCTWFSVNHGTRTVNAGFGFTGTGAGDHGDMVTASDGETYQCNFSDTAPPMRMAAQNVRTGAIRQMQGYLPSWCDGFHISGVSRGSLRDWFVVGVEARDTGNIGGDDCSFDSPTATQAQIIAGWHPFHNEVFMCNALTGAARRLCHHRGRESNVAYTRQTRPSVNWDGTLVAFASDHGTVTGGTNAEYSDLYTVTATDQGGIPPAPPTNLRVSSTGRHISWGVVLAGALVANKRVSRREFLGSAILGLSRTRL